MSRGYVRGRMRDIAGVVDIEGDGRRLPLIGIHPGINERIGQADHVFQAWRVLKPREGRLRTQVQSRVRQAPASEFERWVRSQEIQIVGVLVAATNREDAGARRPQMIPPAGPE